jgi:ribosomal protein S18 acetylase RimI-like enzyme
MFREITFGSDLYRRACALRYEVLRAPLGLPLSEDDLRGEAKQLHFGLFDDDEPVASVSVIELSADHAKIRQTAVAPACRDQGLGRRIMTQLEAVLAARGFVTLSLHARTTAVGFYEKLGYETVGDEFIEVTIAHRKMVKRLA